MGSVQEDEGLGYGSSLPVPSVQEIVRNDDKNIPERYVKNVEDRPKRGDISFISEDIPIIDLSLLVKGDEEERKKLDAACQEWGFFQIINHGADRILTKMKTAMAEFFNLPLSEKKKYAMALNDIQGYGQAYIVSEDQKLDWNDLLFLITLPTNLRNMKYWPLTIPGFREAVEDYAMELEQVGDEIFAHLSLLMGVERDFLKRMHGDVKLGIRMNYYPSCARPDLVFGVSPHSDSSSITLLVQDDEITALQIKHDGLWVPVRPIPNAIVVNIGDVMEAWSNGRYKSIEHRAITSVEKPRISAAAFVIPGNDVELNPVETMSDDDVVFKNGVKYIEYLRYTLGKKMEGKLANIEYLKLDK
ncbi:hypothetical protein ACS0TY_000893 [Phlomoides rotata]